MINNNLLDPFPEVSPLPTSKIQNRNRKGGEIWVEGVVEDEGSLDPVVELPQMEDVGFVGFGSGSPQLVIKLCHSLLLLQRRRMIWRLRSNERRRGWRMIWRLRSNERRRGRRMIWRLRSNERRRGGRGVVWRLRESWRWRYFFNCTIKM